MFSFSRPNLPSGIIFVFDVCACVILEDALGNCTLVLVSQCCKSSSSSSCKEDGIVVVRSV